MTTLAGRPVTLVGEGRCNFCGGRCVRFVCDGQATFHQDPVCAAFVEHAQGYQHVERIELHAGAREFRVNKVREN